MAETNPKIPKLDKQELKQAFDISHFDLNAILRGAQLTFVGGTSVPSNLLFTYGLAG